MDSSKSLIISIERTIKIHQTIPLLFLSFSAISQERIKGIYPCVNDQIKIIQTHTVYENVDVDVFNNKVIIKSNIKQDTLTQKEIISWVKNVSHDSIKGYKLTSHGTLCYLLSSNIKQATGLGINFTSWLIVLPKSNFITEFESLSQNKKLIYFTQKTNRLRYIRCTYGDEFFYKRDWNNVDFSMELNEVIGKTVRKINRKNYRCEEK